MEVIDVLVTGAAALFCGFFIVPAIITGLIILIDRKRRYENVNKHSLRK